MSYKNITTLAAAMQAMGYAPDFVPNVSEWPESERAHKIAEFNVQIPLLAIKGDAVIDWKNTKQKKYAGVFEIIDKESGPSGRGLSLHTVLFAHSRTYFGPRLVLDSEEKYLHFAEYFLPQVEIYYLAE